MRSTRPKVPRKPNAGWRHGPTSGASGLAISVATLERDFEQTIANSRLPQLAREWVRTTSLLERTNRQLRRKFRQVGSFGSEIGAEIAIYVQVKRLNARWSKQAWWDTSLALYFDFRNLNP